MSFFEPKGEKTLYKIKQALDTCIAGSDKEKLAAYSLLFSHKFKDDRDAAHLAIVGPSSRGKSWLLENVAYCFGIVTAKEAEVVQKKKGQDRLKAEKHLFNKYNGIMLRGVTGEVLKRWTHFPFKNHILILSELDGAQMALPMVRQLMSEGDQISLTTEKIGAGFHLPVMWVTTGKPVVAATTASEEIEHQFANRCSLIHLNGSLDTSISEKIGQMHGDRENYDKIRSEALDALRKETMDIPSEVPDVKIPYWKNIALSWPLDVPAQTRMLNDFYRLLKSITAIHGRTTANGDDYEATRLIYCIQKHKFSSPMLRMLATIQAMEKEHTEGLTHEEICDACSLGNTTTYEYLSELQKRGCLTQKHNVNKVQDFQGNVRIIRLPSVYKLTEFGKTGFHLKTFKELMGNDYEPSYFSKPYNPITGEDLPVPEKDAQPNVSVARSEAAGIATSAAQQGVPESTSKPSLSEQMKQTVDEPLGGQHL